MTIRGQGGEDAVLCTSDTTYMMRSVQLSNSVIVVTPPDASSMDMDDDKIVIRDQINEIIELTPVVPKLQKLRALLRGSEYDENAVEEDDESFTNVRIVCSIIDASDAF